MAAKTALGTAVLLYLVLSGRLSMEDGEERRLLKEASARREREKKEKREKKKEKKRKEKGKEKSFSDKWPVMAPDTFGDAFGVATRTVKYTWKETLGKWTLGEIAFGIKYCMQQEGNLQHEYTEGNSVLLKGQQVREELVSLLRYLKLCMYFSKKSYKVFMKFGHYTQDDILVKKSKARLLKPVFTVVRDPETKCILLFIRGAISINERLTAATGLQVPFHHVVVQDGIVTDLILGHAHCGMVVSARWIFKRVNPVLKQALHQFPDYNLKIIGHSMGACVGAVLTYMLREHEEFYSTTCIAFAPAACMSWELAESGKHFITTLVNRTDMVPSFCQVSAGHLRTEVSASSWLNDLRDQIKRTRFLNLVNRSVAFMRSHVPFVSNPHCKVTDAYLLPNTNGETKDSEETQNESSQNINHHHFACFSCMGTINGPTNASSPISTNNPQKVPENITNPTELEQINNNSTLIAEFIASCSNGSEIPIYDTDSDLESELQITKEIDRMSKNESLNLSNKGIQFYPPGRIMHMVVLPALERDSSLEGEEELVNIFETQREMYSKIRLARSMIRDHYMPKYIKTLQMLVDKFSKEEKIEASHSLEDS